MEANVLDVLLFVFENYLDSEQPVEVQRQDLVVELTEIGFPEDEVGKALDWLDDLVQDDAPAQQLSFPALNSMRVFAEAEIKRIDTEARGFLIYLENIGVINSLQRERVLDRAMALDLDVIDADQLKWVTMMVLANGEDDQEAFAWMEEFMTDECVGTVQ